MNTIKMTRDPNSYPVPHAADVHPAEVENYRKHGWVIAGSGKAAPVAEPVEIEIEAADVEEAEADKPKRRPRK